MIVFAERKQNIEGSLDVMLLDLLQLACARENFENRLLHDHSSQRNIPPVKSGYIFV